MVLHHEASDTHSFKRFLHQSSGLNTATRSKLTAGPLAVFAVGETSFVRILARFFQRSGLYEKKAFALLFKLAFVTKYGRGKNKKSWHENHRTNGRPSLQLLAMDRLTDTLTVCLQVAAEKKKRKGGDTEKQRNRKTRVI